MPTAMKIERRLGRHQRIRKKVIGTLERPRMSVFRSHRHLMIQLVNDVEGKTILSASTIAPEVRKNIPYGGNTHAAKTLGKILAERMLKAGIRQVVFDRGGYRYHGRVHALAEVLREGGIGL